MQAGGMYGFESGRGAQSPVSKTGVGCFSLVSLCVLWKLCFGSAEGRAVGWGLRDATSVWGSIAASRPAAFLAALLRPARRDGPVARHDSFRALGRCFERHHPLYQKAGGHIVEQTKQEESGGGAKGGEKGICGGKSFTPSSGKGQGGAPPQMKGALSEDNTWEPGENLVCPNLIGHFLQPQKTARDR